MRASILIACLGWAAVQDPQPGRPIFTSRSDLVVLNVTVIDRKSGPVADLPREAFTVYEDERPQQIAFFDAEDSPATVGLVIDSSMSMQRKREAVMAGALSFVGSTHPRDEIFTVHFNERVWFGLPGARPFTSDPSELRSALAASTARGRTALFDAVTEALAHVAKGSSQKKALIVVSDGGDNSSRRTFEELLAAAARSESIIYTICLTDEYDDDPDPKSLERLAESTGGLAFAPRKVGDAVVIFERIARDLHSGYTIGYVPSRAGKPAYRAIRVSVSAPARRNLVVRSRSGYAAH